MFSISSKRRAQPILEDDTDWDEQYEKPTFTASEDDDTGDTSDIGSGLEQASDDQPDVSAEALKEISFSSLVRAQESLAKDRQPPVMPVSNESRIENVRSQLATIKHASASAPCPTARRTIKQTQRTSKNAPQELSAKHAVSRKRNVVAPLIKDTHKFRDPRFDPAVQGKFDETAFRKNYAFLEDYRDDEIKQLKQEVAKTKGEQAKEKLKKKLMSMQSKKETQHNKDRENAILQEHRKKEREAVKQGKKAFHLKRSDVKKKAFLGKYANLNEKQLEKVMERKRKRNTQKERKNMPFSRRGMLR